MSGLGPVVIGLINIAIFVVIALLIGVCIKYVWEKFVDSLPPNAEKLFLAFVALMALAMLVALLLGMPLHHRFVGGAPFQIG